MSTRLWMATIALGGILGGGRRECAHVDEPGHQAERENRGRAGLQRLGLPGQEHLPALTGGRQRAQEFCGRASTIPTRRPEAGSGTGRRNIPANASACAGRGRPRPARPGTISAPSAMAALPAQGPPSLSIHRLRARRRQARSQRERFARRPRLLRSRAHAGEGHSDGPLGSLTPSTGRQLQRSSVRSGETPWIAANRNAVVRPNRMRPFTASIVPSNFQRSSR